jgi:hypothetical protein
MQAENHACVVLKYDEERSPLPQLSSPTQISFDKPLVIAQGDMVIVPRR